MLCPFTHPVVAQSLKPVKLLSQRLPIFLLFRDHGSVAQQCWICLHSSSNIVGATHAHYTWSPGNLRSLMGCIHSRPQSPSLLGHVVGKRVGCKLSRVALGTRMGCILPTMHSRFQRCWELWPPFALHCQHWRNNSQHCRAVESCCVRLHVAKSLTGFKICATWRNGRNM